MSDHRLRALEREARVSDEPEVWHRVWRERMRLGLVTEDKLRLAAYCGHPHLRSVFPGPGCMSDATCACTYGSIEDTDDREDWVCLDHEDATQLWVHRFSRFGNALGYAVVELWREVCRGYGPMELIRSERGQPGTPFTEPNWPTCEAVHTYIDAGERWLWMREDWNGRVTASEHKRASTRLAEAIAPTWPAWLLYGAVALLYPARFTQQWDWWESMCNAFDEKREFLGVAPSVGEPTDRFLRTYLSRAMIHHALGDYDD